MKTKKVRNIPYKRKIVEKILYLNCAQFNIEVEMIRTKIIAYLQLSKRQVRHGMKFRQRVSLLAG